MARDLMDEEYYTAHGGGKIPIKWTAPEVRYMTSLAIMYFVARNIIAKGKGDCSAYSQK